MENTNEESLGIRILLYEIKAEVEFTVNCFEKGSRTKVTAGKLLIGSDEFGFVPHKYNLGSMAGYVIRINDIGGYRKGMLTFLSIFTTDGQEMRLATTKKDAIINELERRRKIYFETRGLPVPPCIGTAH